MDVLIDRVEKKCDEKSSEVWDCKLGKTEIAHTSPLVSSTFLIGVCQNPKFYHATDESLGKEYM